MPCVARPSQLSRDAYSNCAEVTSLGADYLSVRSAFTVFSIPPSPVFGQRFDPSRALAFSTYARHRILGAMLDFLRSEDPLSRTARKTEAPTTPVTISLDELTTPPAVRFQPRVEDQIDVANARKCLSIRENKVIALIYDHDWPAREVAGLLGVNESRVSQIRHRAVIKLRRYWN